jgi:hypothetical protein
MVRAFAGGLRAWHARGFPMTLVILCGADELCRSTALSLSVVPTSIPLLRDAVRKASAGESWAPLAPFFVSIVDLTPDRARIDLVLMTAAVAILFWGDAEALNVGAKCGVLWLQPSSIAGQPSALHAPPNILVMRRRARQVSGDAQENLRGRCQRPILLAFTHVSFPGVGQVRKEGNHYRWCPVEYRNDAPK